MGTIELKPTEKNYPVDQLYRNCPACTSPPYGRAIELIDVADLDALLKLAEEPRRLFRDPEETFGLYLAPWYKSTEPAPCLFRCLMGALNQIICIQMARLERHDCEDIRSWMAWIRDDVSHDLPASLYSELLASRGDKSVQGMVNVALAYWIEAARALDDGNLERAWPAIAQAHLYIGLVTGPLYANEASARGGNHRASNYSPITKEALRVLRSFPDGHFPHISDAKAHVAGKLASFGVQHPKHRSTSPRTFLDSCSRKTGSEHTQVMFELERVSVRLKGRPPKGRTIPQSS